MKQFEIGMQVRFVAAPTPGYELEGWGHMLVIGRFKTQVWCLSPTTGDCHTFESHELEEL